MIWRAGVMTFNAAAALRMSVLSRVNKHQSNSATRGAMDVVSATLTHRGINAPSIINARGLDNNRHRNVSITLARASQHTIKTMAHHHRIMIYRARAIAQQRKPYNA